MGESGTIVLPIVAVLGFILIILGIINYKKRTEIYEEYGAFFGPFKAYCAFALVLGGFAAVVLGIISMFSSFAEGLGTLLLGLAGVAGGILIYYLTDKKAKAAGVNGIIKKMISAGLGTFWSVELKILKVACFVWIIVWLTKKKNRVVVYKD